MLFTVCTSGGNDLCGALISGRPTRQRRTWRCRASSLCRRASSPCRSVSLVLGSVRRAGTRCQGSWSCGADQRPIVSHTFLAGHRRSCHPGPTLSEPRVVVLLWQFRPFWLVVIRDCAPRKWSFSVACVGILPRLLPLGSHAWMLATPSPKLPKPQDVSGHPSRRPCRERSLKIARASSGGTLPAYISPHAVAIPPRDMSCCYPNVPMSSTFWEATTAWEQVGREANEHVEGSGNWRMNRWYPPSPRPYQ